jgi:hypothetical protein
MIGLCRTTNIVSLDWLMKSAKARKVLPVNDFRLLDDKDAEAQYTFSMRETLLRSHEMRTSGKTLLGGFAVFVCPGVAGQKAKGNMTPPAKEFRLIIEAAGATWLSSVPSSKTKGEDDFSSIVVVTSKLDDEAEKQLTNKRIAAVVEKCALVLTTEQLFHSMMTQQLDR